MHILMTGWGLFVAAVFAKLVIKTLILATRLSPNGSQTHIDVWLSLTKIRHFAWGVCHPRARPEAHKQRSRIRNADGITNALELHVALSLRRSPLCMTLIGLTALFSNSADAYDEYRKPDLPFQLLSLADAGTQYFDTVEGAMAVFEKNLSAIPGNAGSTCFNPHPSSSSNGQLPMITYYGNPIQWGWDCRYPDGTVRDVGYRAQTVAICPLPSTEWDTLFPNDSAGSNNYNPKCRRWVPELMADPKTCGNPTLITRGIKDQAESDYSSSGSLSFQRRYRSNNGNFSSSMSSVLLDNSVANSVAAVCAVYRENYGDNLDGSQKIKNHCFAAIGAGVAQYQFYKPDGYTTVFTGSPTSPTKPANINESAVQLTDAQGIKTWQITREDDSIEIYSAGGLLQRKTTRSGQLTTYTYSDAATPTNIAPRPNLMLTNTPLGSGLASCLIQESFTGRSRAPTGSGLST